MLCYKLYFTTMRNNWLRVLMLIQKKIVLSRIQRVLYAHLVQIYNLAVIYSPLCLSVLCLAIYLLDYTTTNLFLSILSILFLFLSFLWLDYSESK